MVHLQFDSTSVLSHTYGSDVKITDKHLLYNIDSYVRVAPPLIAGIMIDKGYLHLTLFIASIIMVLGPVVEYFDQRADESGIVTSIVCV